MDINWTLILQILGVIASIATILGLILAPALWLGSKIDAFRVEIKNDMGKFSEESKDFHSRLCVLEDRYIRLHKKDGT